MTTKQLYPVAPDKATDEKDGVRGVYYAGMFVPVVEVDGQLFTELSVDDAGKKQNEKFPGWDWEPEDTAASAEAEPWPKPTIDLEGRTYRGMMSASKPERRDGLMSNKLPLDLLPDDLDSLLEEIRVAREWAESTKEGN